MKDVTFANWRVIRELFERTLLLMELEKLNAMYFLDLRKHSMTVMYQVFSLLVSIFLFFFDFLIHDFATADAFHGYFDESMLEGAKVANQQK